MHCQCRSVMAMTTMELCLPDPSEKTRWSFDHREVWGERRSHGATTADRQHFVGVFARNKPFAYGARNL